MQRAERFPIQLSKNIILTHPLQDLTSKSPLHVSFQIRWALWKVLVTSWLAHIHLKISVICAFRMFCTDCFKNFGDNQVSYLYWSSIASGKASRTATHGTCIRIPWPWASGSLMMFGVSFFTYFSSRRTQLLYWGPKGFPPPEQLIVVILGGLEPEKYESASNSIFSKSSLHSSFSSATRWLTCSLMASEMPPGRGFLECLVELDG